MPTLSAGPERRPHLENALISLIYPKAETQIRHENGTDIPNISDQVCRELSLDHLFGMKNRPLSDFFTEDPEVMAVVAVLIYSLIVSVFVYRGLDWKGVWKALDECVSTLAIVLILIATSSVFGYCLTTLHVPDLAASAITALTDNRIILILLLNLILLILGCIMDMAPIILIATPILFPIATNVCGLDPIQFGIMVVLNCGIGLLTPPVGSVLFIGSAVAKISMEKVVKATLPFYLCMIIVLLMISFIPEITLILPRLIGGYVSPVLG